MAAILIIDDDKGMCFTLSKAVRREGHDVICTYTLGQGMEKLFSGNFDVVFLDVKLPDGNGLGMLPKIKDAPSRPEVIIITGKGDPDGAELAIKNGAWDYIEKPSSIKEMTLPFVRALQYREKKKMASSPIILKREGIIGSTPIMRTCLDLLAQAAGSDANVLITGETGTGKELFAKAIHDNSDRGDGNYVVVDCAALPGTLVESTLFGHMKGAFTGADKTVDGLIKHADGGTVFLDEVGELPLSVQRAFLRVLQEKTFRPIGGKLEIKSDFRVLASTNRNLDQMVKMGRFRKDLLFRLRSFSLELPSLRERREDIKKLAVYHMTKICERNNSGIKGFSPDFLEALTAYSWPGNVRELVNTMDSVLAVSRFEPTLFIKHLPDHIRIKLAREKGFKRAGEESGEKENPKLSQHFPRFSDFRKNSMAELERQYFTDLMSHSGGNTRAACKISGLGKSRFYELLNKYNILSPK